MLQKLYNLPIGGNIGVRKAKIHPKEKEKMIGLVLLLLK